MGSLRWDAHDISGRELHASSALGRAIMLFAEQLTVKQSRRPKLIPNL